MSLFEIKSPRDKLSAGRHLAVSRSPYFASALYGLLPREAPGLGTVAVTERAVLLWDPEVLGSQWKVEEIAATLVHEVGHLLRNHMGRCKRLGLDHRLHNLAGDMEINDDLKAGGWKLPDGALYPDEHGFATGLTAEEYYDLLQKEQAQQKEQGKGQQGQGGQKGQGKDQGKGQGKGEGQGEGGEPGQEPGEGQGGFSGEKPAVGAGWCGSAAGRAVPGEPQEGKGPGEGRSEAELEAMRREVAEAVQKEAQKGRGNVPAGWVRWAGGYLKPPKIRWQDKLARAVRSAVAYKAGAVDYSYARPSRRQGAVGHGSGRPILPSLRTPLPRVAVALDTSGSMGSDEVERALSETRGILAATNTQVEWLACDSRVHSHKVVGSHRELAQLVQGGGGTDFRPVFDAISKSRPRPDILVFFTDGQGPAPLVPPVGIKVIWVLLGACRCHPYSPTGSVNYGTFIEIEPEIT